MKKLSNEEKINHVIDDVEEGNPDDWYELEEEEYYPEDIPGYGMDDE